MALSKELLDAYKIYDPSGSPEQAENLVSYLRSQNNRPDFQIPDDMIATHLRNSSPEPIATEEALPNPVMTDETKNAIAGQSTEFQYRPKYTAEKFAELQQQVKDAREKRQPANMIGDMFGALGKFKGVESSRAAQASQRKEEDEDLNKWKDEAQYEDTFNKQKRLYDPNSFESKAAYDSLSTITTQVPGIAAKVAAIPPEMRSAVNLTAMFPAYKDAITNALKSAELREARLTREAIAAQSSADRRAIADQASADRKAQRENTLLIAGMPGRNNIGRPWPAGSTGYKGPGSTANTFIDENGEEQDKMSGVKVDKQGNRTLDPIVAKTLKDTNKAAEAASRFIEQLPDVKAILPKTSQSGIGQKVANAQVEVGYGEMGKANKRMEQFANSVLSILDSPLMKGAPSEADARRALSIINDPTADLKTKEIAVKSLEDALINQLTQHNDAIRMYDDETVAKLKGIGVKLIKSKSAPAHDKDGADKNNYKPPTGNKPTPQQTQPETKTVGGVTYIRKNGRWEEQ